MYVGIYLFIRDLFYVTVLLVNQQGCYKAQKFMKNWLHKVLGQ